MNQRFQRFALLLGAMLLLSGGFATTGHAQAVAGNETCTGFAQLYADAENLPRGEGLLTNITDYVKGVVTGASEQLYRAFTNSAAYQNAVGATITLMIVIYGVGFLIGVVQASFGQVLVRLVKIGMVLTLISPTGWQFFSDYAVKFFNDGTDSIIAKSMEIGTGIDLAAGDSPFKMLDGLAKIILSPDMIIAILGATFNSGPYGMTIAALLSFAAFGLIKLLVNGLRLYAVSFVVRSLMLGVAPVFIVFLLFDRTKQLFTGWLNVLVFLSLQPILYFTFISFFLVMITTASTSMMGGNELCWVESSQWAGSQNKVAFWRFKHKDEKFPDLNEFDWGGSIKCRMEGGTSVVGGDNQNGKCAEFPLNIVDILSFLILIYVAGKFAEVTDRIAADISNSFVNLDQQAKSDLSKLNDKKDGKDNGLLTPKGGQPVK
ncbi:MAG: type IV secretion system protein [Alphaproteobacteria bacterium]|nr:type IV secretion system protein [Alphaproteobacteria bacterium]